MNYLQNEASTPNSGVRTVINVLLMVHFTFIAVAVTSNFLPVSAFRARLGNIPFAAPYAQLLSQDVLYNGPFANFALTDGPFSMDYRCRVILQWRDGVENDPEALAQLQQFDLLPDGLWPNVRRQRYLQLCKVTAMNAGDGNRESRLPAAISNYLLSQVNEVSPGIGDRHRFQCNARGLLDLPLPSSNPQDRDPLAPRWFRSQFEADVVGTGEAWALNKVSDRGEVTQVQQGGQSNQARPSGAQ